VTATSISVDNANAFPGAGTFIIDSEQIAYTAKFGNTFVNVQRGVNGTVAAAHASGAQVRFLSTTIPTPPRPTATPQPRDVIYQSIGQGSGCAIRAGGPQGSGLFLAAVGLAACGWRKRRSR
jgi:hypothetical protein